MVDPVRPPDPPPSEPVAGPEPAAQAPEFPPLEALPPEAPTADPPRVYALPTARKVVSSGLQLALASTGDLRRASIYIGLLVLGAFGPAIIAILLIVGRLGDQAGPALGDVFFGGYYGAPPQPALEAALLVVAIEALVGFLLFFTITIDAQVMAIAILGGRAGERPVRLWEAIIRARQTFWRMAGAGTLVGFVSLLIQLLLVTAIGGLSQSAEAASIVAAIIATIVVAPLAYVSTSIVLGDVGAMEALSRSWRLFRVRRSLAVVVVLFTLVTSAIQLFALGAGLDLVVRASEVLHVSLTEGALSFVTAVVLILAAVVAYGSLTFTIGAVVSAPQVTGFLGLTFYAAGLDRARVDGPKAPRGFRYVSRPMAVAMIALAGIVGLQVPAISSIPQLPGSSLMQLIRDEAAAESDLIDVNGYPVVVEDPAGDLAGGSPPDIDLVRAEATTLGVVPAWLLDRFQCGGDAAACGVESDARERFGGGAYLFLARGAGVIVAEEGRSIAVLLAMENEVSAPRRGDGYPYGGASRVFITRPGTRPTLEASRFEGDVFGVQATAARSIWSGPDLYLIVPITEIPDAPIAWDVVAAMETGSGAVRGRDTLRTAWESALRPWEFMSSVYIDDFRDLE